MSYLRPDWKKEEKREVEPLHVACMDGDWYLVAHCRLRKGLRHFALSRIRSARMLDERFEPLDFDPQKHFANRFGRFVGQRGESHDVAIRFSAEAALWVLERQWHPKQKVKRHRGGAITLSFPAPDLFEVRQWVLSWGADAKALRPKQLREDVAREARALVSLYRRNRHH
jgi:predicted DNA-binding transcriptional regulator YafY